MPSHDYSPILKHLGLEFLANRKHTAELNFLFKLLTVLIDFTYLLSKITLRSLLTCHAILLLFIFLHALRLMVKTIPCAANVCVNTGPLLFSPMFIKLSIVFVLIAVTFYVFFFSFAVSIIANMLNST